MAVKNTAENNNNNNNGGPAQNSGAGQQEHGNNFEAQQQTVKPSTLGGGFGSPIGAGIITANNGSADTTRLAADMLKFYTEKMPSEYIPKINILTKEPFRLAYDTIVVSNIHAGVVYYHLIIMEATGIKCMTAKDISATLSSMLPQQMQNIHQYISTPDMAIDNDLHEIVTAVLKEEYKTATGFYPTDGLVINTHVETDRVFGNIAATASNANISAINTAAQGDLNLKDAITGNQTLEFETLINSGTAVDTLGNPVRNDILINLVSKERTQNHKSMNGGDARVIVTAVNAYVDTLVSQKTLPATFGAAGGLITRYHPHIIINNATTSVKTVNYMLLNIIAGTIALNESIWLAPLLKDDVSTSNIGALNILTNIENNAKGLGSVLNLNDKKLTKEQAFGMIKDMISEAGVLSYDVKAYGENAAVESILVAASSSSNAAVIKGARKKLVQACHSLTNGAFPLDFDINSIFATEGADVPAGYYDTSKGLEDIANVDMAFVATQTGDVNAITDAAISKLPKSKSGADSFLTTTNIIAQHVPGAVITGKKTRVTFNTAFLNTLIASAKTAGLVPTYNPEVILANNSNLATVGNVYANAFNNNIQGFNPHMVAGSNAFIMPNTMGGYTHY